MPPTTPISRSKTAALARILDCVPKGYHRYVCGTVTAIKAEALAKKFHALYGIGCTPAQRLTRKGKGLANVVLVFYWPEEVQRVEWLLLAEAVWKRLRSSSVPSSRAVRALQSSQVIQRLGYGCDEFDPQ